MTPGSIMEGLTKKNRLLTSKNDEYLELAEKKAQAEKNYNIVVTQMILTAKQDGHPVTLIPKIVAGDTVVAELKFQYDVACAIERACLEAIKDIRSQIDTYRSLLSWLKAELTGGS